MAMKKTLTESHLHMNYAYAVAYIPLVCAQLCNRADTVTCALTHTTICYLPIINITIWNKCVMFLKLYTTQWSRCIETIRIEKKLCSRIRFYQSTICFIIWCCDFVLDPNTMRRITIFLVFGSLVVAVFPSVRL